MRKPRYPTTETRASYHDQVGKKQRYEKKRQRVVQECKRKTREYEDLEVMGRKTLKEEEIIN